MQNSLGLLLNWSRKSRSDAVGSRRICRLYFIVQQGAIMLLSVRLPGGKEGSRVLKRPCFRHISTEDKVSPAGLAWASRAEFLSFECRSMRASSNPGGGGGWVGAGGGGVSKYGHALLLHFLCPCFGHPVWCHTTPVVHEPSLGASFQACACASRGLRRTPRTCRSRL